ncbi:MAG: response regulator transcription factor [Acidobacteriota bacterium]
MMADETILIIEDDPTLLRGLKDNFEGRGYRVVTASDGEQGLTETLTGDADLILLDIMLPDVNGFEICQQARGAGIDTPIVMLTARGQEDDTVRGLNLGADDYVTKPFAIRELVARVRAFLRRRGSVETSAQCFGDLVLDHRSHRLLRRGREVPLTPKEFKLLELFLQRAGRALTRDEILRRVWGHGILVTHRSVDRCVTTLRSKIEPDPRRPVWIRTIRDVGYRFEPGPSESLD